MYINELLKKVNAIETTFDAHGCHGVAKCPSNFAR